MNKEELKREICNKIIYRSANLKLNLTSSKETRQKNSDDVDNGKSSNDATFILISNDNKTKREYSFKNGSYVEELDIKGANYSQLKTFFKDHEPSVDNAIGSVVNLRIENNQLLGDVVFGSDNQSKTIKQKYNDGILTDVSIGYCINDFNLEERENEDDYMLVTDYSIFELSAVWKGADIGAIKLKSKQEIKKEEKRFSYSLYEKKLNLLKEG